MWLCGLNINVDVFLLTSGHRSSRTLHDRPCALHACSGHIELRWRRRFEPTPCTCLPQPHFYALFPDIFQLPPIKLQTTITIITTVTSNKMLCIWELCDAMQSKVYIFSKWICEKHSNFQESAICFELPSFSNNHINVSKENI